VKSDFLLGLTEFEVKTPTIWGLDVVKRQMNKLLIRRSENRKLVQKKD
jgi:hypothetical protein